MEEHVPSDKMTASDAGRVDRFCRPTNQVQRRVQGRQVLPFYHSGIVLPSVVAKMPYESLGSGVNTHIYRIRKNFQISQLWCIIKLSKNHVCRVRLGMASALGRREGKAAGPSETWGLGPIPSSKSKTASAAHSVRRGSV